MSYLRHPWAWAFGRHPFGLIDGPSQFLTRQIILRRRNLSRWMGRGQRWQLQRKIHPRYVEQEFLPDVMTQEVETLRQLRKRFWSIKESCRPLRRRVSGRPDFLVQIHNKMGR